MAHSPFTSDKEEECEFCRLLREIKEGRKPVDALFENPIFNYRGLKICCGLTHNREDADDLFQDVRIKVLRNIMDKFVPDYTRDYGNFFAWLRQIAQNRFYDNLPKPGTWFDDERVEDLHDLEDHGANTEFQVLCGELEMHINNLPDNQRLATTRFMEGYSLREIQRELNNLGIKCSHVAVGNWVRNGLKPFFPDAKVLSFKKSARKRKAHTRTRTRTDNKALSVRKVSEV
jgi:RNA polymerase sigma factor (sigma-70 family)